MATTEEEDSLLDAVHATAADPLTEAVALGDRAAIVGFDWEFALEALEKVELFLDAVYGANLGGAYIIHGHGSGALKRAVRGWLPTSSYVKEFRRGERGEGGDGVTVAFLRST